MRFTRYVNLDAFRECSLDALLEDEVCNNLPISIVTDRTPKNTVDWLMGTVMDDAGNIEIITFCTPPFNMLLFTPDNTLNDDAVQYLGSQLRSINYHVPGVTAKTGLARLFAEAYTGCLDRTQSRLMMIMKLDKLLPYDKAPGICRVLTEDDLSYVPLWEQAFSIDCRLPPSSLEENKQRIHTRIGLDIHYIWEDALPVSQAVFGRETPNGGVVTWVYTPPLYRNKGYATSVVGELSNSLFNRGKKFCCLFADANNPVSRGIYSKLGYYDVCELSEISFSHSDAQS